MVKSELILKLAEKADMLSLKDVEHSVNHILEKMSEALAEHERIEIRGFGSFSLHYRPPRKAHNHKTGDRVYTEAKYTPHFKPGKELRERVNESQAHYPIKDDGPDKDGE
jgi:integration host factor subunit beta